VTGPRNENKVRAALEKVWLNSRPEAISRLAVLESFIEKLRSGRVDDQCLDVARSAAHRLAGSLGMFGLDEGSSCAGNIEALLCQDSAPDIVLIEDLVHQLHNLLEATPAPMKTQQNRDL
jgi:HPt (histidine-containing phosphotransfer) domain-containing protein